MRKESEEIKNYLKDAFLEEVPKDLHASIMQEVQKEPEYQAQRPSLWRIPLIFLVLTIGVVVFAVLGDSGERPKWAEEMGNHILSNTRMLLLVSFLAGIHAVYSFFTLRKRKADFMRDESV